MTPDQLIFIVGFPRGGTRWLLSILAAHTDVSECRGEPCTLCQCNNADSMIAHTRNYLKNSDPKRFYAQKAPLDAKYIDKWVAQVPESKMLFIVRNPLDVVTSHQRGTMQWLYGRNKAAEHVMRKLRVYYDEYRKFKSEPNLMLTRYERLYFDFYNEVGRIYDFIGLDYNIHLLKAIKDYTSFEHQTGRKPGDERQDQHRRKGIVGDWQNHMRPEDLAVIDADYGWFFEELGYEPVCV